MTAPSTIAELDQWMTDHCYNNSYAIGNRIITYDGLGLDTFGSLFVWYYNERGNRNNLAYFHTEKEAVNFAFQAIIEDKNANRHLIGFVKTEAEMLELTQELDRRGIRYFTDSIPFGGLNDPRFRVFVFGCDVKKVSDLESRYRIYG